MKRILLLVTVFILLTITVACNSKDANSTAENSSSNNKTELTISAAVSMTDALEDIQKEYEKTHDVILKFNLGSSGTLAQQIEQGAPVDVFISANQDWMDNLVDKGEIDQATRKDVTGNNIVMITNKDTPAKVDHIEDLGSKNIGQIAIGNPESVPAGKYTKETLESMNKWDALADNFIMAKDVRQVLTYVESQNANIGFVYGSDASTSNKVIVIDVADTKHHAPIIYPAAVTTSSKHQKEAKAFIDYLESEKGQRKLEKYGFKKQ